MNAWRYALTLRVRNRRSRLYACAHGAQHPELRGMKPRQVQARLIERDTNFRQWAIAHGYKPRTVTQAVHRWAGARELPRGRLTFAILRQLSRDIGGEVTRGISKEEA